MSLRRKVIRAFYAVWDGLVAVWSVLLVLAMGASVAFIAAFAIVMAVELAERLVS